MRDPLRGSVGTAALVRAAQTFGATAFCGRTAISSTRMEASPHKAPSRISRSFPNTKLQRSAPWGVQT
jgi:hypothetical protein